jgi:glucokinase
MAVGANKGQVNVVLVTYIALVKSLWAMKVLVGDIGGTKTLIALAEVASTGITLLMQESYVSKEYKNLEDILERFLKAHGGYGFRACFGVAGPVFDDVCKVTNLPWVVDARTLARCHGGRVRVINDFQATALGVSCAPPESIFTLHPGVDVQHGTRAVLGAGTGLGEAISYWASTHYDVIPTEGGHTDLAPRNPTEDSLLQWLRAQYGHVSYERVVSGAGLVAVYNFLREHTKHPESLVVKEEMSAGDPAAVIGRHAVARNDMLCSDAFDLWAGIYGAEAGNLALKCLARGGVYLAGGIAAKVLLRLEHSPFLNAMHDKGRMSDLVKAMPVRVVTDAAIGLLGAASAAARL